MLKKLLETYKKNRENFQVDIKNLYEIYLTKKEEKGVKGRIIPLQEFMMNFQFFGDELMERLDKEINRVFLCDENGNEINLNIYNHKKYKLIKK